MSVGHPVDEIESRVALVTGAAKRLGANTAKQLHEDGLNVLVHCHQSVNDATSLVEELNSVRENSALMISGELGLKDQADQLVQKAVDQWGRLDVVVNNASSFYPTSFGAISDADVADLMGSNFAAPLFVSQAAVPYLAKVGGCIINMVDIHAYRPYQNHSVYCAAKSALVMLTQSMALELAPEIRVNGVAPGAILWPEGELELDAEYMDTLLATVPLQRQGDVSDIGHAVVFLASSQARYITGQILSVDGGKSLC